MALACLLFIPHTIGGGDIETAIETITTKCSLILSKYLSFSGCRLFEFFDLYTINAI